MNSAASDEVRLGTCRSQAASMNWDSTKWLRPKRSASPQNSCRPDRASCMATSIMSVMPHVSQACRPTNSGNQPNRVPMVQANR